ncbi:MAG: hypothetical protein ACRDVG_10050 [Jatrophihabitantaceae bacterium]
MNKVSVLPSSGAAFADVRDNGRSLRVAWHASEEFFVLSIWRDGVCVATSRVDRATSADLIDTLVRHLAAG